MPGSREALGSQEPIDPDIGTKPGVDAATLLVIAIGGVLGAVARYEAGLRWPTLPHGFPWTTLGINLLGSALLSIVVVIATDLPRTHRLFRPMLGTGVIGGFTTFSTFAVENQRLLTNGHIPIAFAYMVTTVIACIAVAWAFDLVTRAVVRRWSA
jgi:CrcB protein